MEILTSDTHLKEMKQKFYDSLCENYPKLAKELRYALYREKKDIDERLNVIILLKFSNIKLNIYSILWRTLRISN